MSGFCKIKKAAEYTGISERTLRDWLKDGLKHSRLPSGTILIKYSWIDEYLESFAAKEDQVDKIVNETLRALK
jgi:excisionase family DNA binding protein